MDTVSTPQHKTVLLIEQTKFRKRGNSVGANMVELLEVGYPPSKHLFKRQKPHLTLCIAQIIFSL